MSLTSYQAALPRLWIVSLSEAEECFEEAVNLFVNPKRLDPPRFRGVEIVSRVFHCLIAFNFAELSAALALSARNCTLSFGFML